MSHQMFDIFTYEYMREPEDAHTYCDCKLLKSIGGLPIGTDVPEITYNAYAVSKQPTFYFEAMVDGKVAKFTIEVVRTDLDVRVDAL